MNFFCFVPCFVPQIFVRAFDSDERLVGVAFLDVGVYVTSLQTLKNLLLIGDAVKSVQFVAFQVCDDFSVIWVFVCDTECFNYSGGSL